MTSKQLFLLALAAMGAAIFLPARQVAALQIPVTEGDAKAGRRLFVAKGCYECHGYAGQGTESGPKLAPGLKPLAFFQAIVRHPPNQMPPYSKTVLSDAELADMHAFLATIPPGKRSQDIGILERLMPAQPPAGN